MNCILLSKTERSCAFAFFDGQYKNRNNNKKIDTPEVAGVDTRDALWTAKRYRPFKKLIAK